MSVVIKRNELSEEQVSLIRKFLFLQPKEKYNYGTHHSTPKTDPVMFYSVVESENGEKYVFVPYRFAEVLLGENRNLNKSYTPSVFEFNGTLRDYQAEDMPLAIDMLEKHGTATLGVYPGYGKCLSPGTEILMFNGTKKVVEDIRINDQLMGDDSKPRNVLSITSGKDEMYEIIPERGESFSVNKNHILTLWIQGQGIISKNKNILGKTQFVVNWFNGETYETKSFKYEGDAITFSKEKKSKCIFDIKLSDYLDLKNETKHKLKCLYSSVSYPEQKIPIDPYYLGLLLGYNKTSNSYCNTKTLDKVIIEYLEYLAIELIKNLKYKEIKYKENTIIKELTEIASFRKKYIPLIYKINTRKIRLKLLAGIIDACGYLKQENGYEIIEMSNKFSYDIQDLCRSLGFACYIKTHKDPYTNPYIYERKNSKDRKVRKSSKYNIISIYGTGIEDIPVLVPEKKARKSKTNKNVLTVGFTVKPLGIGNYHGFEVDKNGRFLLGSFMVTHNSSCSTYLASKYQLLTVVLMHRTTLIKQWQQTFTKFTNARLWIVGEEEKPPIFNVIICLDERVSKIPLEIRNRVGTLVIDEAHAFCTKKQCPRLLSFHPKYIIALSATLERDDGMHEMIYAMCGDHKITREMKKEFHVYKVETGIKGIRKERKGGKGIEWHPLAKSLAFNKDRNNMIVAMAMKNPTHKIVILTGYVDHTKLLHKILEDIGESVDYLCGNKKNYKNSRILIGTIDKIGTGFDEESFCDDFNGVKINLGILAHSIASKKVLEQSVGRVFRSNFPNIFHLVDDDKTIQRHWVSARRWYKSKGGILHK